MEDYPDNTPTPSAITISPFAATEAHDKYYEDFGKWLGELSFDHHTWNLYLPPHIRDVVQERFVKRQLALYHKDEPHLIDDPQQFYVFRKAMAHVIEHRYQEKGFGVFLDCDADMLHCNEEMFESDEENCPPTRPVTPSPQGHYMTIKDIDTLHEMCERLCNDDDDCTIVKEIEVIQLD